MSFLLVRHGHVDYEQFPGRFRGHGIDLLPLSPRGLTDVEAVIPTLRRPSIDVILSSPMTRALQTAMILSRETAASVEVEMDLHEWVPDRTQRWSGPEVPLRSYEELLANGGEWPPGQERDWEQMSEVRARVASVLKRYVDRGHVVVVCHAVVIEAMTGVRGVEPCAVVPFDFHGDTLEHRHG